MSEQRERPQVLLAGVALAYAWTCFAVLWAGNLWNLLWFPIVVAGAESSRGKWR